MKQSCQDKNGKMRARHNLWWNDAKMRIMEFQVTIMTKIKAYNVFSIEGVEKFFD